MRGGQKSQDPPWNHSWRPWRNRKALVFSSAAPHDHHFSLPIPLISLWSFNILTPNRDLVGSFNHVFTLHPYFGKIIKLYLQRQWRASAWLKRLHSWPRWGDSPVGPWVAKAGCKPPTKNIWIQVGKVWCFIMLHSQWVYLIVQRLAPNQRVSFFRQSHQTNASAFLREDTELAKQRHMRSVECLGIFRWNFGCCRWYSCLACSTLLSKNQQRLLIVDVKVSQVGRNSAFPQLFQDQKWRELTYWFYRAHLSTACASDLSGLRNVLFTTLLSDKESLPRESHQSSIFVIQKNSLGLVSPESKILNWLCWVWVGFLASKLGVWDPL